MKIVLKIKIIVLKKKRKSMSFSRVLYPKHSTQDENKTSIKSFDELPLSVYRRAILSNAGGLVSILGLNKPEAVLDTARHRCDNIATSVVLARPIIAEMGTLNS